MDKQTVLVLGLLAPPTPSPTKLKLPSKRKHPQADKRPKHKRLCSPEKRLVVVQEDLLAPQTPSPTKHKQPSKGKLLQTYKRKRKKLSSVEKRLVNVQVQEDLLAPQTISPAKHKQPSKRKLLQANKPKRKRLSSDEKRLVNVQVQDDLLAPQTPSPAKHKQPSQRKLPLANKPSRKRLTSADKKKLVCVQEKVTEAAYYTRSLHKFVADEIESVGSSGLSELQTWKILLKESEPNCLRERVQTFIVKVGEIQGRRKYQQWKGSVMDSICGAFLSQRVSDQQSSNAFMMLRACFPMDPSCKEYGKHHRVLRVKRSLTNCFSQKKQDISSHDRHASTSTLKKPARKSADEEKRSTSKRRKGKRAVSRKEKAKNANPWLKRSKMEWERDNRSIDTLDCVDWAAVLRSNVKDISEPIAARGMQNHLAERIKGFLELLLKNQGNLDLEWIRDETPEKADEVLRSIYGLGLKSRECVRLLTLGHPAFPVDINVARVTVRLGWVPAAFSDEQQMDLLNLNSIMHECIHQYLWPSLSMIDHETLYELHCQMITFGKVFCTKKEPNCANCPMQEECKYYANPDDRKKPSTTLEIIPTKACKLSDTVVDIEDLCSTNQKRTQKTRTEVIRANLHRRVRSKRSLVKNIHWGSLDLQNMTLS